MDKILYVIVVQLIAGSFCGRSAAARQPGFAQVEMMPGIAAAITEQPSRADSLAVHYWDKYDFSDSAFLARNGLFERSFADFAGVLSHVSEDTMKIAVENLVQRFEKQANMFPLLMKATERFLYEPDSPVCDESKLIVFLERELQSPALDETSKIRPKFLLESAMKNRVGCVASDIAYTFIDGRTGTLHAVKADYTLLYFNDPGCDECALLTSRLASSPEINNLIGDGKLKILTVYVNDDVEAWEESALSAPGSWLYTRDAEQKINAGNIYDIKRFPTIYLLDKDKKVLLKDTTFEQIEKYFK